MIRADVPVDGARLRLRALIAMGHSPSRIAVALKTRPNVVNRMLSRVDTPITPVMDARITALFEAWWDKTPPIRTTAERRAAITARKRAYRQRWCTAMGLDDELIDIVGYTPAVGWAPATGTGTAGDDPLGLRCDAARPVAA